MGRRYERDETNDNPYDGFGASNFSDSARAPAKRDRSGSRRARRDSRSGQGVAPRDSGVAPKGYRQELWDLALLFEQKAEEENLALRAGVPVIHNSMESITKRLNTTSGVVRRMVALFWWDYVELDSGVDALRQFTGMAQDLLQELRFRASTKQAAIEMDKRGKPEPQARERKAPAKPREEPLLKAHPRNRQENEELAKDVRERISRLKDHNDEMERRRQHRTSEGE